MWFATSRGAVVVDPQNLRNNPILVHRVDEALAQIKVLSGLLPICASCNQIRDDSGSWNRIESYIESRTTTTFSHSICPECLKKLYPEYADSQRRQT